MLARYKLKYWDEIDEQLKVGSGVVGCGGHLKDAAQAISDYYGEDNISWVKILPWEESIIEDDMDLTAMRFLKGELDDAQNW